MGRKEKKGVPCTHVQENKHQWVVMRPVFKVKIRLHQTCVSPRVKRALPCALGSNPHLELIGRISSKARPSLLLPPCNKCNKKSFKK